MAGKDTSILLNNEKDTIPRSTSATGTITKVGNNTRLIGVGTLFTTEFAEGDWIYVSAIDEVQKVRNIISATELDLEEAFSGAVSGASFAYVSRPRYNMVSWNVTGTGDATVDGVAFSTNEGNTYSIPERGTRASGDHVDPVVFDTSTNSTSVIVTVSQ